MNTNPDAKRVICYGDSNTWGDNPHTGDRFPADIRWPGVLQNILGSDYEVVSEGLCGRTFVATDQNRPHLTGITHLKSILSTNDPIDIITVMLGTNDLKDTYGLSAEDIADHLRQTVEFIKKEAGDLTPQIIVICPAPVSNTKDQELDERLIDAPEKSRELAPLYETVAKKLNCLYFNAGDFISLENTDGYHLDAEHHKALGEKVADVILSLK